MADDTWYPAQGNGDLDGLWYPACTNGEKIFMGFESAGACMRYMTRSGLAPTGVHMSKHKAKADGPPVALAVDAFKVNPWPVVPLSDLVENPADLPPDNRSEWIDTRTVSDIGPVWTRGRCYHNGRMPVDSYPSGELVAWWCADCGEQFDADRWPVPDGMHIPTALPDIIRPPWPGEYPKIGFVDQYADPSIIGTDPGFMMDTADSFLKIWNGLKATFSVTWPIWLVAFYFVVGVITK
jgi:hypothetical protein